MVICITFVIDYSKGFGKLTYLKCTYYGSFVRDAKNGQGILKWKDGSCYEGSYLLLLVIQNNSNRFKNNHKDGVGKSTYADGSYFIGSYKNDQKVSCVYIFIA
jgi:hypothetical protein